MKLAKLMCVVLLLVVFGSLCKTFIGWSEDRGVYDDILYLRQAHLFERFGWKGFDTDIKLDTDNYLAEKLRKIDFPAWNDPNNAPSHNHPAKGDGRARADQGARSVDSMTS